LQPGGIIDAPLGSQESIIRSQLELGKDGAQVPFTVDQQMVRALSA